MNTKAERETQFWQDWREADYSWEGLASHPWRGWRVAQSGLVVEGGKEGREATLQDYWRDQERNLVSGDGKLWTQAHCPLHWSDGTPAKAAWNEAQWQALNSIVRKKIAASKASAYRRWSREALGADGQAQLKGTVIRLSPALPSKDRALFLSCDQAWLDQVNLTERRFESVADFDNAFIEGDCRFGGAIFVEDASFHQTTFSSKAVFTEAEFEQEALFAESTFVGLAIFIRAKFKRDPYFRRVDFYDEARFSSLECKSGASFSEAEFFSSFDLHGSSFGDDVQFSEAVLHGKFTAEGARFSRFALFWNTEMPRGADRIDDAFSRTRFESAADFTGAGTHWIAALDHAIIQGKLVIDRLGDDESDREFRNEILPDVVEAAARKTTEWRERRASVEGALPATDEEIETWYQANLESFYESLEGGCRTLKAIAGKDRDELIEQRYYRYQLMARQAQPNVPLWERLSLISYGTLSNYGTSISQPLVALLATFFGASVVYWSLSKLLIGAPPAPLAAWLRGDVVVDPAYWEALQYSGSRVFPFGAFGSVPESNSWLRELLFAHGPGWGFLVRAIATFESLVALVLAFLFALALRRRFQIS